jgi:hypothetical protein
MMRSGWTPDDPYLFLEAGPYGRGHQHEDKLNIILHAHGKTILTEPGNYSYDSSDWRRYVLSTRAHNTVLVDGMEQHRRAARDTYVRDEPVSNPWVTGDDFDYVEGTYADGYGPENDRTVTHTRKLLFVRPDYWICVDHFTPADDGAHVYEALFHLDAESVETDDESLSALARADDAALAIVPLQAEGLSLEIVEGQTEPVVQGWLTTGHHNELRPIPTLVYRAEAAGETAIAYALVPFEGNESPLSSVEAAVAPEGVLHAALRWADGSVHHFAHNPDGVSLTVGPANTDAVVAFVSCAADGAVQRIFEYQG